jgi:hypothetical protein
VSFIKYCISGEISVLEVEEGPPIIDEYASVSTSGSTIVVGVYWEDSSTKGINGEQNTGATNSGAAFVFVHNGNMWMQQAYLKASNTAVNYQFGYSVSISGDTIVVGSRYEGSNATGVDGDQSNNNAGNSGAAYVFVRDGNT